MSQTDEISRKLSISERNISYKSCKILNDLFSSDLVSLILGDVAKVKPRSHQLFLKGILCF